MTTHTPLARYSATNGALVSGFATAELHHLMGTRPRIYAVSSAERTCTGGIGVGTRQAKDAFAFSSSLAIH
ncbi:hypothetical protein NKH94_30985, partial [Mesorhizobium australicum]